MTRMNGGQALVRSLAAEGLRVVFGVPGAGQYEAIDAPLFDAEHRYISVRHEQAASYMADGYARAGGEVAAALVVEGPGLFNAMSGIATAYATSSPILVVTGGHHHRKKGLGARRDGMAGAADEVGSRACSVRPKYRRLYGRRSGSYAAGGRARWQLRCRRPFLRRREVGPVLQPAVTPGPAHCDDRAVRRAAELLIGAQRPVIWAGWWGDAGECRGAGVGAG